MELFHIIDDGAAILRLKGGLFKQTKIFRRDGHIYAGISGGFLKLTKGGGTINPYISCHGVEGPGVVILATEAPKWVEPTAKKQSKLAAVG